MIRQKRDGKYGVGSDKYRVLGIDKLDDELQELRFNNLLKHV